MSFADYLRLSCLDISATKPFADFHEIRFGNLLYKKLSGSYELRESRFKDSHI